MKEGEVVTPSEHIAGAAAGYAIQLMPLALRTLAEVMLDKDSPPMAKVRAAESLIDQAGFRQGGARELARIPMSDADLDRRIAALRLQLAESEPGEGPDKPDTAQE